MLHTYCLSFTVFAQVPASFGSAVGGLGGTFATLVCLICCCVWCCCYFRESDRRYSRHVSHHNRNPLPTSQRLHTSTVIYDQNCQVGVVTPSRGNTVSYAPPYAYTSGRPLYTPVAPQYKLSGYSAAEAPPPYSSLFPPYNAVQSELMQHIRVHNEVESGAVVQAEPRLHAASDSEVQNEVESGAVAQAEPLLHTASNSEVHNEVESGAVAQAEPLLHTASDSEVQNEVEGGAVAQAEPRLYAASDSEVHNEFEIESGAAYVTQAEPLLHTASDNEVESGTAVQREVIESLHATSDSEVRNEEENVDEVQAEPTIHAAPSIETPNAENQELQPTSTPRPGMEMQVERIDFQVDSDEESSVVSNPYTR